VAVVERQWEAAVAAAALRWVVEEAARALKWEVWAAEQDRQREERRP
jgi:hypothetical protein